MTDVGLRAMPDENVWSFATLSRAVIVTRDLDYPLPVEPKPEGVILLRVPQWYQTPQILEVLGDFVRMADESAIKDVVTVVEPGRDPRRRPLSNA